MFYTFPRKNKALQHLHDLLTLAHFLYSRSFQNNHQPTLALTVGALVQPRHEGVLSYLVLVTDTFGETLMASQRRKKTVPWCRPVELGC